MGTRAQVDVQQGNKIVRVYTGTDGFPRNILPALRAAASEGRTTPFRIAQSIVRWFPKDFDIEILDTDDDQSDWASYHYVVDVSSKPWRVRQTKAAVVNLPIKPGGSLDYSSEALRNSPVLPAVTRSFRIG